MTQATDIPPWYRQFWPWFLIALPASVVVAGIVTLVIAMRTSDGLVVDDYYKEGLAINRVLERDQAARRLGLQADVQFTEDGDVRVIMLNPKAVDLGELTLRMWHPTRDAQDVVVALKAGADGTFSAQVGALPPGNWHVVVESDSTDNWRLLGRIVLPREHHVRLD